MSVYTWGEELEKFWGKIGTILLWVSLHKNKLRYGSTVGNRGVQY